MPSKGFGYFLPMASKAFNRFLSMQPKGFSCFLSIPSKAFGLFRKEADRKDRQFNLREHYHHIFLPLYHTPYPMAYNCQLYPVG